MQRFQLTLSILLLFTLFRQNAQAQTEYDAQRYSEVTHGGTARSQAMAGAMTAVGADFGNLNINPAGFGLFTRSQLQITPALQFFNTDSYFLGANTSQFNSNFSIGSLGLVLQSDKGGKSLSSFTFAFGYNTLHQHRRHMVASGFNAHNSITNYFAGLADGRRPDNLSKNLNSAQEYDALDLAAMAYNTGYLDASNQRDTFVVAIIDNYGNPNNGQYFGAFNYGNIQQTVERIEKGRTNEWGISFAGNFDDRLHLGATIGIVDLEYSMTYEHKEEDTRNLYNVNSFDRMKLGSILFKEDLSQSGIGINLTVGGIYQPTDNLRFGLMLKTPSVIAMTDTYFNGMEIRGDNGEFIATGSASNRNTFEYTLYTPAQANIGASLILGKKFILGLDGGLMSYKSASFSSQSAGADQGYFRQLNQIISNAFATSYNLRLGAEFRVTDLIFLRGGFGYYSTPYGSQENTFRDLGNANTTVSGVPAQTLNTDRMVYSGGIGFKGKSFFFDATLMLQNQTDKLRLYSANYVPQFGLKENYSVNATVSPEVEMKRVWTRVSFTIGVMFGGGKD
jgi:hypothetical protein